MLELPLGLIFKGFYIQGDQQNIIQAAVYTLTVPGKWGKISMTWVCVLFVAYIDFHLLNENISSTEKH